MTAGAGIFFDQDIELGEDAEVLGAESTEPNRFLNLKYRNPNR